MTISVQAVYLFALLFPFRSMYTQFVLPPVMSCMHIVPFLMLVILLLLLLLHPFNGLFSRTTWISQYQKGDTSLDLNEARDNAVLGYNDINWTTYANNLHLAPDRLPHQHLIAQFLQAGCSS